MKNLLLLLLIPFTTFAQKSHLKNGDLLFININCGPMCEAINAVTEGYKSNDFNHMGLVVSENNKDFYVYEAIGKAVVKTPLNEFLSYTKQTVYIGQLKRKYRHLIPEAIAFCESQLGVAYDSDFIYDNGKYYCSELIYDAFLSSNKKQPFFQLFPMTYKEPNSQNYFPIWVAHFAEQAIEIPEGKPGCNPGGMSLDQKIRLKKMNYSFQ
ncbi:YiiX/YebB-like N1pC/P60 family cysteine hydrolase [Flavobacterium sp. W1B]|uniref:YiiX/YebB-like N1pC/P60 family cysteine hydrolase n=1 Tax=Flavobacterium sp. W1B TaxID=3394146 RepID=UPI0039BD04EB